MSDSSVLIHRDDAHVRFAPSRQRKSRGSLDVICGPMFAGKSTEILKRVLWNQNGLGRRILILKPAFDTRYGATNLASHDGLSTEARAVTRWPEIDPAVDVVFLDEIQFFIEPHFQGDIVECVTALLARGVDVVVAGLDSDWRAQPFFVTGQMLALADTVVKLKSRCSICGHPASKNFKKKANGLQIELGEADLYEARCNDHWHDNSAG